MWVEFDAYFYPCIYMFSIWDAYRDAGGAKSPYSFLPFAFSAYFVTVGLIYSSSLKIFGVLFGPVFLPMLFLIPGISIGLLIKSALGNLKVNKYLVKQGYSGSDRHPNSFRIPSNNVLIMSLFHFHLHIYFCSFVMLF
jgi:hypothetical protein